MSHEVGTAMAGSSRSRTSEPRGQLPFGESVASLVADAEEALRWM